MYVCMTALSVFLLHALAGLFIFQLHCFLVNTVVLCFSVLRYIFVYDFFLSSLGCTPVPSTSASLLSLASGTFVFWF